jgi:hypothetical protein
MLVVDPAKRITIAQIRQHRWMQADPTLLQQDDPAFDMQGYTSNLGDYNEQVLGIMQALGIDRQRTIEVSKLCGGRLAVPSPHILRCWWDRVTWEKQGPCCGVKTELQSSLSASLSKDILDCPGVTWRSLTGKPSG